MKKKMFFCLFLFLGSSTFIIGQPSQDIGINYLNEFYARYVASCCKEYNESYFDFLKNHGVQNIDSSADAEERLLKENCTDELYAKIDSLRVLYILDYDPFICAQDCFKGLFSFSITNHSIPEWYQMNYMDDSNQERVIYLNLVKINGKLKIANIRTCLNEDIMDLSTNEENAEYK